MTEFIAPFIAGIMALFFTSIGIYIIRRYSNWGERNINYFVAFASGILITISLLHMIPESMEMSENAPYFLFGGYFMLFIINHFLHGYACERQQCNSHAIGLVPMLGIAIHSFIDGIIYSITFSVSVWTGSLAALGMIMHEIPEGIVTFMLLIKGKYSKAKATRLAILGAGLTTPLGVIVSFPFIQTINQTLLGNLLSLSAGALLFVGATHLLPEMERDYKRHEIFALVLGILLAMGIILLH